MNTFSTDINVLDDELVFLMSEVFELLFLSITLSAASIVY
jgi:hypothetical protein